MNLNAPSRMLARDKDGKAWEITRSSPSNVEAKGPAHQVGVKISDDWHGTIPPMEVIRQMDREGY